MNSLDSNMVINAAPNKMGNHGIPELFISCLVFKFTKSSAALAFKPKQNIRYQFIVLNCLLFLNQTESIVAGVLPGRIVGGWM
jgi:hypothetical protein